MEVVLGQESKRLPRFSSVDEKTRRGKPWEQLKGGRRSHAWLSSSLLGHANVQETQAAGFFPVNSSPQNPSLPLASLSVTKHICINVAQTEVLTLTLEQGPPWKDLQAHLLLLVPGKPGHAAWGVKLVEEGVGREGLGLAELWVWSIGLTWRERGI